MEGPERVNRITRRNLFLDLSVLPGHRHKADEGDVFGFHPAPNFSDGQQGLGASGFIDRNDHPAALLELDEEGLRNLAAVPYPPAGFLISCPSARPAASEHPRPRAGQGSAPSFLSGGDEALELLEPVLDEGHFGDRRRLPVFELDHEKSLRVKGQVIALDCR